MAEAPDTSLNCSICLDPFKDPRLLPCCHTFCKECLERTLKQQTKPPKKYPAATISMLNTSASSLLSLKKTDASAGKLPTEDSLAPAESLLQPLDVEMTSSLPIVSKMSTPLETYPTVPQKLPSLDDFEERPVVEMIRCPLCKVQHTIPEGGIESFEHDYTMAKKIESESLTKSLSKSSNIECKSCSENIIKETAGLCNECHIICERCVSSHKKLAIFKSHHVVPLDDYSPEKHIPKRKQQLCSEHNKEIVLYCDSCSQTICPDCVVKRHKAKADHDFVSLDEADEALCTTVRDMSQSVKNTMAVFQNYREYIQGVEKELGKEGYAEELKKRINARFEEHIRELQARREALITKVEDNEVLAKKNLWAQKNSIDTTIAKIEAGMRFTERALQCHNPIERIKMNKQGKELLSQVVNVKWDYESIPPPLVYRCNKDVDILTSFGEVSPICPNDVKVQLDGDYDNMSIAKSVFRSQRIEIKLEEPAIIKVKFLVPLIKLSNVLVRILYGKRKAIFDKNEVVVYESEEESTWNVEFVPRCTGVHIVQVWVGGIAVTNETITVKGSLKVGSKVQPGPDWEGPSTLTIGRVIRLNPLDNTVTVDWTRTENEDEPMATMDTLIETEEIEAPEINRSTFGGDHGLQLHTLGGNLQQHKWGDNEQYEVELVL